MEKLPTKPSISLSPSKSPKATAVLPLSPNVRPLSMKAPFPWLNQTLFPGGNQLVVKIGQIVVKGCLAVPVAHLYTKGQGTLNQLDGLAGSPAKRRVMERLLRAAIIIPGHGYLVVDRGI